MKACVYTKYGPPGVLQYQDREKPTPEDDEVLIRVHAASANPQDWHNMRGEPFFYRLMTGLRRPKCQILGSDIAGSVEAVGGNVTQFQPGDEIYGDVSDCGFGAYAEYVCAGEDALAQKPISLTFEEAAAVPLAGVTALQALRDKGSIEPGQKVLINGASGGVGTSAVQIAKSFDTDDTGVCSTRNLEMVRSIGADHVIDYTQEDFTQSGQQYDLIADAVGNRSVSDYERALAPEGACVIIGFTSASRLLQHMVRGSVPFTGGSRKIGHMGSSKPNRDDLEFLKDMLEAGKLVPVIDRRYSLSEVSEALRYLEEGHARGKVVISVE